MGEVLVALGQIVGEIVLQAVFQVLGEIGIRSLREPFRRPKPLHPVLAAVGYGIFGAVAGGVSLWLLPAPIIDAEWLRVANLVITPLVAGLLMSVIGAWRRKRGEELVRLDRFGYGFLFALCMAGVRFSWGAG